MPQNHGQRVNAIQKWGGGEDGESWCCFMATMWLDLWFKGKAPVPRTGSCEEVLQLAIKNAWVVTQPEPGDLYVYLNDAGLAHHIGVVTDVTPLTGIAGNTSQDGTSANGDGVYEHELESSAFPFMAAPAHIRFIRVPGIS